MEGAILLGACLPSHNYTSHLVPLFFKEYSHGRALRKLESGAHAPFLRVSWAVARPDAPFLSSHPHPWSVGRSVGPVGRSVGRSGSVGRSVENGLRCSLAGRAGTSPPPTGGAGTSGAPRGGDSVTLASLWRRSGLCGFLWRRSGIRGRAVEHKILRAEPEEPEGRRE